MKFNFFLIVLSLGTTEKSLALVPLFVFFSPGLTI